MKQSFHKTLACSLAFLVLFSTSAFAVSMHYCGKILVDYSVLNPTESCGMDQLQEKDKPASCSIENSDCCHIKKIVKNQDDVKGSDFTPVPQQVFLTTFFYTYHSLFAETTRQITPFNHYTPPLLVTDIHLLSETFII